MARRFWVTLFDSFSSITIPMQYLMMVYIDEQRWAKLAEDQGLQRAMHRELWDWYEDRVKRGQIKGAGRLRDAATATTVREIKGKHVITDGPFAETKEVLGGFHLLDSNDRAEAVAIAGTFPGLSVEGTTVEVRQVMTGDEEKQRWQSA